MTPEQMYSYRQHLPNPHRSSLPAPLPQRSPSEEIIRISIDRMDFMSKSDPDLHAALDHNEEQLLLQQQQPQQQPRQQQEVQEMLINTKATFFSASTLNVTTQLLDWCFSDDKEGEDPGEENEQEITTPQPQQQQQHSQHLAKENGHDKKQQQQQGRVRVVYQWDARSDTELSVRQGEELLLVSEESEEWWLVSPVEEGGKAGFVPSAYLTRL